MVNVGKLLGLLMCVLFGSGFADFKGFVNNTQQFPNYSFVLYRRATDTEFKVFLNNAWQFPNFSLATLQVGLPTRT